MPTLTSVGDTLLQMLNEVLTFIPKLVGAALWLLIGYIIARLVRTVLTKGLRALKFDQVADRAGITRALQMASTKLDAAAVLAEVAFWWIFLMFIENAVNALGMTTVTAFINSVLGYLPNVFAAILIVVVGSLIANVVAGIVRGATGEAGLSSGNVLASLARWAIVLFAVLAALTQLNVAQNMIFILFAALVGMVALAGGLAFGLGGRETAGQMLSTWYSKGQQAMPKLGQVASQASQMASNGSQGSQPMPQARDYVKSPQTIEFTAGEPASQEKFPQ